MEEEEGQGEAEQVVYCAVGKEAGREWKANLLWVLANLPRTKRLVFVHLHRPPSRINMMGAWVPVSQLAEQEVTAHRQLEKGKIGKVLDDLLDICKSQKVNASKTIIAADDTAGALVQFVDDHGVTELVMGAASDRAYHRKMRAPRSKKALMVQRRANPCCKIWFVCKGNLICTREGSDIAESSSATGSTSSRSSVSDYSRSKSSPRLHSETSSSVDHHHHQIPSSREEDNNVEDSAGREATTDIVAGSSKPWTSEEEPAGGVHQEIMPSPDDGFSDDDDDGELYEKLKDAMVEAENMRHEAYEETRRRQMAERDLAEANKVADEAESSHQKEARRRKEVEEMLARERAEMERDRQELDGMLEQVDKVKDRSAELEAQIASSERVMSELEARLSESYTILDSLRRERGLFPDEPEPPEEEEEEGEGSFRRLISLSELEEATNHFDESLRIDGNGDGGRGKVYRGRLRNSNDNMDDVAVKVLDAAAVSSEEVEAMSRRVSRRRHPALVEVVGACPEARAVVYELLPGARCLEDRLASLPWHVRCGVALRTCQALAFLHSTGAVHGDVRPANILVVLDHQDRSSWTSKLAGLGTRRRPLVIAYADPGYVATGELTPHCDVYSLGVVLLQLVTGKPSAFLARKAAQEAAAKDEWHDHVVDQGWPVERAREVALVALRCCDTQNQQPAESLLEEAMSMLEDAISAAPGRSPSAISDVPSYFLCPILREVMRDPQIAADGFSYEAEAIREWIGSGHDTSPMTNLRLPTRNLTPNHALRSAIQQWRQRCQPARQLDHH